MAVRCQHQRLLRLPPSLACLVLGKPWWLLPPCSTVRLQADLDRVQKTSSCRVAPRSPSNTETASPASPAIRADAEQPI